jgi:hypothetical protein
MTDERKIQQLKARRRHVESAGWNRICCQVSRDITDVMDPDAELMAASRPSVIDSWPGSMRQLAEFGIEPPVPKTGEQTPNYFMMILGDEAEKRPTSR